MDRDEISNLYRGPSIDASYQVSVHLAEGFQRRRLKCEKLTEDRRRTTSDDKSCHYMNRTQTSKAALLLSTNSGSNLSVGAPCHRYDGYIIKYKYITKWLI